MMARSFEDVKPSCFRNSWVKRSGTPAVFTASNIAFTFLDEFRYEVGTAIRKTVRPLADGAGRGV